MLPDPTRYDPTGGSIWEAMRRYQQQLQGLDQRALGGLARTYREIQPDFRTAVEALDAKIAAAAAKGLQPSASWVFQQERYRALEQQVLASTGRLTIMTGQYATDEAAKALEAQNKFFERLASGQASYGDAGDIRSWATLPERSLVSFMGLSQGSPLLAKFEAEAGRDAMRAVRTTLAGHLATGRPARQTARLMADRVAGVTLTRAMTITRTETARARRAAAVATFQQNPAVRGWVWRAELDKSCPACIALHGQEFPTDEMQAGHPNCRCVMVPMRHRGVNPNVGTGGEWLARQPMDRWDSILGRGRANWLRDEMVRTSRTSPGLSMVGHIDAGLRRMVTYVPNRGYGGMYRPVPVRGLLGRPAAPALPPPTPKGSPTLPNVNKKMVDDGDVALDKLADKYAEAHGMTPTAYKAALEAHVRGELGKATPVMRRSVRSSDRIVADRRFKSQFETGTSGGANSASARGSVEYEMFQYPKPANRYATTHAEWNKVFPGEQRPVYGYMKHPEMTQSGMTGVTDGASWYGDIQWIMKPQVRQRATFTHGDSLSGTLTPGQLADTAGDYSAARAVATGSARYGGTTDPLPGRVTRGWKVGDNGYTEVQYHGGLHLDDVAEVLLPLRQRGNSAYDRLAQALEREGIAYRWED